MNPIVNQMMGSALGNNNFLQMYSMVKNAQNPNALLQTLINQNPKMQQVMNVINQYGGNAQQAFYSMAQQQGKDPNSILSLLK